MDLRQQPQQHKLGTQNGGHQAPQNNNNGSKAENKQSDTRDASGKQGQKARTQQATRLAAALAASKQDAPQNPSGTQNSALLSAKRGQQSMQQIIKSNTNPSNQPNLRKSQQIYYGPSRQQYKRLAATSQRYEEQNAQQDLKKALNRQGAGSRGRTADGAINNDTHQNGRGQHNTSNDPFLKSLQQINQKKQMQSLQQQPSVTQNEDSQRGNLTGRDSKREIKTRSRHQKEVQQKGIGANVNTQESYHNQKTGAGGRESKQSKSKAKQEEMEKLSKKLKNQSKKIQKDNNKSATSLQAKQEAIKPNFDCLQYKQSGRNAHGISGKQNNVLQGGAQTKLNNNTSSLNKRVRENERKNQGLSKREQMEKKQNAEKSKKILNDSARDGTGRGAADARNNLQRLKNKKNERRAERNNNKKDNRHNQPKNSKQAKNAEPIHVRTSNSQDHSGEDLSSFVNSDEFPEDGDDGSENSDAGAKRVLRKHIPQSQEEESSQKSTSDKSDCFSDTKIEKSFKRFLRILIFVHRRDFLIQNLNQQIDNQFKQSYILDNYTPPPQAAVHQLPLGMTNANQISEIANQINGREEPEQVLQMLLELKIHLQDQINEILQEFNLHHEHTPESIDSSFIMQLQSHDLTPEQSQQVNKLLDLLIQFQEVKFQIEKIQPMDSQPTDPMMQNHQLQQMDTKEMLGNNNRNEFYEAAGLNEESEQIFKKYLTLLQMRDHLITQQQYTDPAECLQNINQVEQEINQLEDNYNVSYKSIRQYLYQQSKQIHEMQQLVSQSNQDGYNQSQIDIENCENLVIRQIHLDDEQLQQIKVENLFFCALYQLINQIIGPEGKNLKDFINIIDEQFPQDLRSFCQLLDISVESQDFNENSVLKDSQGIQNNYLQGDPNQVMSSNQMLHVTDEQRDPNLQQQSVLDNNMMYQQKMTSVTEQSEMINQILQEHGITVPYLLNLPQDMQQEFFDKLGIENNALLMAELQMIHQKQEMMGQNSNQFIQPDDNQDMQAALTQQEANQIGAGSPQKYPMAGQMSQDNNYQMNVNPEQQEINTDQQLQYEHQQQFTPQPGQQNTQAPVSNLQQNQIGIAQSSYNMHDMPGQYQQQQQHEQQLQLQTQDQVSATQNYMQNQSMVARATENDQGNASNNQNANMYNGVDQEAQLLRQVDPQQEQQPLMHQVQNINGDQNQYLQQIPGSNQQAANANNLDQQQQQQLQDQNQYEQENEFQRFQNINYQQDKDNFPMTGAVVRQSGAAGDTNNNDEQYTTQKVPGQAGGSMAMPPSESQYQQKQQEQQQDVQLQNYVFQQNYPQDIKQYEGAEDCPVAEDCLPSNTYPAVNDCPAAMQALDIEQQQQQQHLNTQNELLASQQIDFDLINTDDTSRRHVRIANIIRMVAEQQQQHQEQQATDFNQNKLYCNEQVVNNQLIMGSNEPSHLQVQQFQAAQYDHHQQQQQQQQQQNMQKTGF